MRAEQCEFRVAAVIEGHIRPSRHAMALSALRAVDPRVRVVVAVTADALLWRLLLELVALVARFALQRGVAAAQREARARKVIERELFPVLRGVTLLTLDAVVALVVIVVGVAADARLRRVLVFLLDVTANTGDPGMRAGQGVVGLLLVVEAHVLPRCLGMAVGAGRAQISVMPVVFRVTCIALGLRGVERLQLRGMAVGALRFCVLAVQREVRHVVIELVLVEMQNVGRPSHVLGVAGGTSGIRDRRREAMESRACGHVTRHVLVTIEAQRILEIARKGLVAGATGRLEIRVRGRERAGHDEPLERVDLRGGRARHTGTRHRDNPIPPSLSAHDRRPARLVHVHGKHMNECCHYEHVEEGQMKHMP